MLGLAGANQPQKPPYSSASTIDLGDITTARGAEMVLPLWLRLFGVVQSPLFNLRVVGYGE